MKTFQEKRIPGRENSQGKSPHGGNNLDVLLGQKDLSRLGAMKKGGLVRAELEMWVVAQFQKAL